MPDEQEVTDEALMLSLANGDEQAFVELFNRWKSPLISYFYRSLNDYHRSEDLALKVASKVYKQRGSYKVLAKFSTWLFRIAQNLLRDEIRRLARRPTASLVPEMAYEEAPSGASGRKVAELEDWLMHTINRLREQERSLVLLVYQQGFTPAEAAEVLEITPNHARVLLHKARTTLVDTFKTS